MKKNRYIPMIMIAVFVSITAIIMIDLHISSAKEESNFHILIDVEESKLYLFQNNTLEKIYPCAGGKQDTPSPIGTWTIINKGRWGEGFGGNWMGLNVPWGKFGIHGTLYSGSVGWNSSHRLHSNEQ